jgi:hypothetical protein
VSVAVGWVSYGIPARGGRCCEAQPWR